jgi:predicted NBD/HSP70 family sugar kinase
MSGLLAGLDIGGSKVQAVAVERGGGAAGSGRSQVVEEVRLATALGADGVVRTAQRALAGLAERLGARPPELFAGVGIGVPGLVDPERGVVVQAVNLGLGAGELDLARRLRETWDLPIVLENDVNAGALGAADHLGLGEQDVAYLSIGTGIAAGILLAGQLRRGPHLAAGEIGHVPVDPAGPVCACGQHGCLEAVASGSAIAARWPQLDGRFPSAGGGGPGPAGALFAAAAAGDPEAVAVRDEVAVYLAAGVRMLALTVDVDLVILGGGVAEVGEPLRAAVADQLRGQAVGSAFLRGLDLAGRLRLAPAGTPVAAIGAALLAQPLP